ncbi:hypothetical protein FCL40_02475 [Ferrimonas sediminicola]|uniref:Type II secretion system protein GspB C-terminal domain-containing protein n=1 Tax=Ferrimonas sediminicola TaxID=2569538 RepID=A0A4U1BJ51_9GAMM|nr:general secretion pathway protein GspB [Ferrimonas sediminicola]TKB51439.1 hypothetical protein FCL40_02475 [Ferrimonas sediminicola]
MSYLLDAVGREKQQQGLLDPALAAPLAPKRALPWHFGWPLVGAVLGAGLGWLAASLQPAPEPEPAVTQELAVIRQLTMPVPVSWEPVAETEPQYVYQSGGDPSQPELTEAEFKAQVLSQDSLAAESASASPAVRQQETTAEPANAKLLAAFERAVADLQLDPQVAAETGPDPEVSAESLQEATSPPPSQPQAEVPKLGTLPWNFQKRLPDINITAHVYSSDAGNRWLRANGRELQEGDSIAEGVTLKEIRPNEVVLEMAGQVFSVPALGQL